MHGKEEGRIGILGRKPAGKTLPGRPTCMQVNKVQMDLK
jgi:hypothetical protein